MTAFIEMAILGRRRWRFWGGYRPFLGDFTPPTPVPKKANVLTASLGEVTQVDVTGTAAVVYVR